jgi:predicted transcriptional regulator of viral defense system
MDKTEPRVRFSGLSAKERDVLGELTSSEKVVVRADDILRDRSVSRAAANLILSRLHAKGWLRRVKRGVYSVIPIGSSTFQPVVEDAWALAMELFAPCYISGWSAAEHWNLTEQIFNAVSVVTAYPQRRAVQDFAGVRFFTRTISRDRVFGTKPAWFGSRRVEIADRHRLLIDILDSPALGGGGRHTVDIVREYWRSAGTDPDTLLDYAQRYNRGVVCKRLGLLAELFGSASGAWLGELRSHISAGISRLDPSGPDIGRVVKRWGMRINIPLPE